MLFVARTSRRYLIAAVAFITVFLGQLVPSNAVRAEPATVEVGIFVSSLYDLDFYDETFETIVWLWFVHDEPDYDPLSAMEFTNAREYERLESYSRFRSDGRRYVAAKYRLLVNQTWDIADFPFDRQRMDIVLESVGLDATQMKFVFDQDNSVIAKDLKLSGWAPGPVEGDPQVFTYNTTFGEESSELLAFPRVVFSIPLKRDNPKLFFEAYIGYLIAVLMCAAIWLTAASGMPDYRIGMILAAIFSAIGNKHVLESTYPSSPTLGLADYLEISTFLLITASMVLSVGCERLHLIGRDGLARRLNFVGIPIVLAIYAVFFVIFVTAAASGGVSANGVSG